LHECSSPRHVREGCCPGRSARATRSQERIASDSLWRCRARVVINKIARRSRRAKLVRLARHSSAKHKPLRCAGRGLSFALTPQNDHRRCVVVGSHTRSSRPCCMSRIQTSNISGRVRSCSGGFKGGEDEPGLRGNYCFDAACRLSPRSALPVVPGDSMGQ